MGEDKEINHGCSQMEEDGMNWGYARLSADIGRVVHGPKLSIFFPPIRANLWFTPNCAQYIRSSNNLPIRAGSTAQVSPAPAAWSLRLKSHQEQPPAWRSP